MASVNKVIIVGNLGRDPEVRRMPSGDTVVQIAVATSDRWKDKGGEQREATEWHRVAFFGRQAEIAEQFLKKGAQVYIEGRLRSRKYADKDGIEKTATEIVAEHMQMLGGRGGERSEAQSTAPQRSPQPTFRATNIFDDDIPF